MSPSTFHQSELIVVTEHFYPSTGATAQLVSDLVDELSTHFTTTVLTSTPSASIEHEKYTVIRLCDYSSSSPNVLKKTLAGFVFLLKSSVWILFHSTHSPRLLIVSNPPFVGIIGLLARITKSSRYVYLLQDIFPRSAVLTGVLPARGPLTRFWTSFMSIVLSSSSHIVVLNQLMKDRCIKDFSLPRSKIVTIDNWAVECAPQISKHDNPIARLWGTESIFTVQYSGNFGRLHDMLTILEASRILRNERIKFTFIGDGAKRSHIIRYKHFYQLENISVYPYQSRANLRYSLGSCDVSVISMIPGSEDTVAPSKFYGIIASGKPVLLIAHKNSDMAQHISSANCGRVVAPGDPEHLADVIRELAYDQDTLNQLGQNALTLYREHFGHYSSSQKYIKLLKSI